MKVKELQAKLQYEHPDAEATPCTDEHGKVMVLVTPPVTVDGAIDAHEEAVRVLGGHVKRLERIRLEVAAFYGLPILIDFITTPPLEGLGKDPAAIRRLLSVDNEGLVM